MAGATPRARAIWLAVVALGAALPVTGAVMPSGRLEAAERHGFSPLGDLAYPPGFTHFAYLVPGAPKGGHIRLARTGTFDSTNGLRYPGTTPAELSLIYDRLMVPAADEPASYYGLLAESVDVAEDLGRATFRLHPSARWHDGRPVSAADVVHTFETLKAQGAPFYRQSYRAITITAEDARTVAFTNATPGDREFPGLVGSLPVHPAHAAPTLDTASMGTPLGSGPYRVVAVDAGRRLDLERVADYWASDHPANRGRWNFDRVTVDYYRDEGVAVQAFLAGGYDLRIEEDATRWLGAYDAPPVHDGRIVRATQPLPGPGRVTGLVFNLRRGVFADPRVREAVTLAYDFERANQLLFGGLYQPVGRIFGGSDAPFSPATPPTAPRDRRATLRRASDLLDQAGFPVRDGHRIDPATNQAFTIDVAYLDHDLTRVLGVLAADLERLGVTLVYPLLEPAAAREKLLDHQFDLGALSWAPSRLPGRAERLLWGSALADRPGSYALSGAKDADLDSAIAAMLTARSPEAVRRAARRFDEVMETGRYMVPLWRVDAAWIAFWDRFGRPSSDAAPTPPLESWWWDRKD